MDLEIFEQYVHDAIRAVPERFRQKLHNVAFVVEPEIRGARPGEGVIMNRGILLGLYQGVPYGSRGPWYSGALPDKITLFQSAIEQVAGPDPEAIRRQVAKTVWHEIGHYFGMNETEVRKWERRRQASKKS